MVALGYTLAFSARVRTEPRAGPSGWIRAPSSPPAPIVEHADVLRMLLAQKAYAKGYLARGS